MTITPPPAVEPLEAFPIPDDALVLHPWNSTGSAHELAIAALQQAMAERHLELPLGPQLDLANPSRLLSLNRFALQVLTAGLLAEHLPIPLSHWQQPASAPQLLLAALVDEENGVVQFPGVITAPEFLALARTTPQELGQLQLPATAFRGSIDRLFSLVQILQPGAIAPQALPAFQPAALILRARDWLAGVIPESLAALGAEPQPLTAGAFRQSLSGLFGADAAISGLIGTAGSAASSQTLAILSIPFGLGEHGTLLSGEASRGCIERFRLLLIPTAQAPQATPAAPQPERLILLLLGELEGDLLPDGLELTAVQGIRRQSVTSSASTALALELPATPELIEVSLTPPGGTALLLPPLQLPS
jgi:hypothetical protein